MQNAHLRMGKLTFARQTRDTITNVSVGMHCLVADPPDSREMANKTPRDFGRLTRWIQEVLQAIDRESFFPNFGWACHNCQFRKRCWSM